MRHVKKFNTGMHKTEDINIYFTNLPTFKLKSDIGGVLMSFNKTDLKSSKVKVDDNVIWEAQ